MDENEQKRSTYVVLVGAPESGWVETNRVDAASAEAAIRRTADLQGEGKYVAIPARSWKPISVSVETKKVVSLG